MGEASKPAGHELKGDGRAEGMPGMRMENGVGPAEMREGGHAINGAMDSSSINGLDPADPNSKAIDLEAIDLKAGRAVNGPPSRADRAPSPPPIKRVEIAEYKDLSELIVRLVQETFNDLTDVIRTLSEMPPTSQSSSHALPNGSGPVTSQAAVQKKTRLMDFIQHRRAQFIKVLVLAQWSRQTDDVRQAIDLLQWLRTQAHYNEEACLELGRLKLSLGQAKLPNPDLSTALEVLSTGKTSWLPDLGSIYMAAQPLTAKEMLSTLRNINTLLSIRLNLHENLPPHFDSFTIASGRATFNVPDEFEVDLSIADENPSSQLYFIDIRFLFTPFDSEILKGRLRDEIEAKAIDVLKTDGLSGCYGFLHELVLTHKINVLRRQADELSRGKWTESIRLEMVRRTLVVQYWLNRPGGKSWIELGVKGGAADAKGGSIGQGTSTIAVRWMREGKEVKDTPITLQLKHLSMDATLKHVIALHTSYILRSIRDRLLGMELYSKRILSLSLSTSSVEPAQSLLRVQLTPSRTARLAMEPIGGRFALEPASLRFNQSEHALNSLRDPAAEAHNHLSNLRCWIAKEEIENRARCVGWELRTLSPKQEDMKRVFPRETLQVSFFGRPGWSSRWIVAVSVGMAGEEWWIIEYVPLAVGYTFGDHQRIPISSTTGKSIDPTYDFLSRLEKASAGMITHLVNVRTLARLGVQHALRSTAPSPQASMLVPNLVVRFSSLMSSIDKRHARPWAKDVLKLTYQGISSSTGEATMMVEARLTQPKLFDAIRERVDDDIVFHPSSGAFAFHLRAPVGEPLVSQLRDRLLRIQRLILFLHVVRRFDLPCESISLGRLVFRYSSTPPLRATVGFAGDAPITLRLDTANPHLRIADLLARMLNADGDAGLEHVTMLLGFSLPLFRALDEVEGRSAASDSGPAVFILPRAAEWLQLRYSGPGPVAAFEVRLRQRRDEVKWFIYEDATSHSRAGATSGAAARPPALDEALRNLMNGRGEGWQGLRTGIVAGVDGVADAVRRIDDIMRPAAKGGAPDATATTAAAPITTTASTNPSGATSGRPVILD